MKLKSLEHALVFYRSRHQSKGCVITHLIGVPMLMLAPFALLFGRKYTAAALLANGLFLQWLGHAAYEKNQPTVIETRDPLMIPAAIIFVTEEWTNVLSGKGLPADEKPLPQQVHRLSPEEEFVLASGQAQAQ